MNVIAATLLKLILALIILQGCNERKVSFIVASDPHFDGTPERYMVYDTIAGMINNSLVMVSGYTEQTVPKPFGLFVTGDITDNGEKEQWDQFKSVFGLNGERKVNLPVYETFGNHDGNAGGLIREDIRYRNPQRQRVHAISDNGLHYSIRKGGSLFIVLGSYPGDEWDPNCEWCHYFRETFREPEGSLSFLSGVLAENSKGRQMPVYLFFHYGWDGFSKLWWTEVEQARLRDVIAGSDVRAIFHGHDHSAKTYRWEGIPVYAAGSPQRGNRTGNFLFVTTGKSVVRVFDIDNKGVRLIE